MSETTVLGVPDVDGLDRDEIRIDGELYMERFYLSADRRLRYHHIVLSDPGRDLHDHPWDFTSHLLAGSYRETTTQGDAVYVTGDKLDRKAEMLHRLTLLEGPMWTFVQTGPIRRRWGFQTSQGWVYWAAHEKRSSRNW